MLASRCRRAILVAVALLGAPGCRDAPRVAASVEAPVAEPGLQRLPGGWIESRREVYGRIPARLRFRVPATAEAGALASECWAEIQRLGGIFNAFDPASETGRVNAAADTRPVPVSREMSAVVATAARVHAASGGAFDPTLWPVKRLWQDAVRRQRVPTAAEIQAALGPTGLARVRLIPGDPPSLGRDVPGLQLDFGGIAKGYAVDQVAALLERRGTAAALVQVGGEIQAWGVSDVGPWRVGVQHPAERGRLYGVVEHRGRVRLSTSGDYQQPLRIGGATFAHVFDPHTGQPVTTRVRGVTVAAFDGGPDNATLDAVATAMTVLGAVKGRALAARLGAEALVIEGEPPAYAETITAGFAARWRRDPAAR